ncbi:F5A9.22 [Arabidopsis thaliana]|nr:F5A9.22 [Arabidopsis thaliana]
MSLPLLECKYVTEEFVREGKNGNYGTKLPSSVPMLRFLYELSWILVRGELPIQSCKAVLEGVEFLDKPSREELASCFADVVTQIAQDLTMSGDQRSRLIKLCPKVQPTDGSSWAGCKKVPDCKRLLHPKELKL